MYGLSSAELDAPVYQIMFRSFRFVILIWDYEADKSFPDVILTHI